MFAPVPRMSPFAFQHPHHLRALLARAGLLAHYEALELLGFDDVPWLEGFAERSPSSLLCMLVDLMSEEDGRHLIDILRADVAQAVAPAVLTSAAASEVLVGPDGEVVTEGGTQQAADPVAEVADEAVVATLGASVAENQEEESPRLGQVAEETTAVGEEEEMSEEMQQTIAASLSTAATDMPAARAHSFTAE